MRTVERASALRAALEDPRRRLVAIGFVPTMGALHDGHLALVDEARRRAGFVVMSIFVNPLQFGPHEDFARYPRAAAADAAKAASRGVDLLFTPSVQEVYPETPRVTVSPGPLGERWEGASRPGHFAGVLTVLAKLFNIVRPDVAIFGQKDIQQATLVRALVQDLSFPISVLVAPTVREPDGLALSSRNAYLSSAERRQALSLSRALRQIADAFDGGERDAHELERRGRAVLAGESGVELEYLALVDPLRLEPVPAAARGTIVVIAARVGTTRLIDNVILGTP